MKKNIENFWKNYKRFNEISTNDNFSISEVDLSKIENEFSFKFPNVYKELIKYFSGNSIELPGGNLLNLNTIDELKFFKKWISDYNLSGILNKGFIPIGYNDDIGSHICIDMKNHNVFFLSHEIDSRKIEFKDFKPSNITFTEFIEECTKSMDQIMEDLERTCLSGKRV